MNVRGPDDSKVCAACGRRFAWRKKWERNWDDVRYCSKRCSGRRITDIDTELEQLLITLLAKASRHATIGAEELAREAASDGSDSASWRTLLEPARSAARRLAAKGQVEILQNGRRVDPSTAKGPIQIRSLH